MPDAPIPLRDYLAADERLTAVYSATLAENSPWIPVSLGVTDRRLLCVSDAGTFLNLDHESIAAIRSRPRTTRSFHGFDYRLLMGVGCLVTILSIAGVITFAGSPFAPLLLVPFVGGLASAEHYRRAEGHAGWPRVIERVRLRDAVERVTRSDRADSPTPGRGDTDNRQVMVLANGLIAVIGFVGIAALAASWLVVGLSLATVSGIALVDYAYRHRSDFDGIEIDRHYEREVSIVTTDGGTVRIRCDASEKLDRELSRLAFVERPSQVPSVTPRSKSAAGAGGHEG